jgi:hypothetical protein
MRRKASALFVIRPKWVGQGFGNLRSIKSRLLTTLDAYGFQVPHSLVDSFSTYYRYVYSARLLQISLPLVKTYGFSREALARSVLCLGTSGTDNPTTERTHAEPLSDTAVSALFGSGDEARRSLVEGWLEEGLRSMENLPRTSVTGRIERVSVRDALRARLEYNEPVLSHLPEVRLT